MVLAELDLAALRRWGLAAGRDLTRHAPLLDRINVYPVPDSDTGTNLRLTLQRTRQALIGTPTRDLPDVAASVARASLLNARGNSGVILSQIVRGIAQVVEAGQLRSLDGRALARALRTGSDLAWRGVAEPVEGTILSVARAAAEGAERSPDTSLAAVVQAAVAAAQRALAATTGQVESLRNAGVVDAGAAGYFLILEALQRVVNGSDDPHGAAPGAAAGTRSDTRPPMGDEPEPQPWWRSTPVPHAADPTGSPISPAYEVMYVVADSDPQRMDLLRTRLTRLGDSLVIGGGPQEWSVHVHVDDPAAALEAGAAAGRTHRFALTRFADQRCADTAPVVRQQPQESRESLVPGVPMPAGDPDGAVVLALVCGPGLLTLAQRLGHQALLVAGDREAGVLDELAQRALNGSGRAIVVCDNPATAAAVAAVAPPGWLVAGEHPAQAVALLEVLDPELNPAEGLAQVQRRVQEALGHLTITDLDHRDQHGLVDVPAAASSVEQWCRRALDTADVAPELLTIITSEAWPEDSAELVAMLVRARLPELSVVVVDGRCPGDRLAVGLE